MSEQKIYWKGLEELTNEPSFVANAEKEFASVPEPTSNSTSSLDALSGHRRDFLKVMGFGMAAVSLAACETPVKKAIPFLNKPEEYDPSIANYYASSFVEGGDYCAILVKTREGRPIKVEGNKLSSVTQGGTSARVQASVLGLYDTERFKGPQIKGKATTWQAFDAEVGAKLAEVAAAGGRIVLVTNTIISPSFKQALTEWTTKYPTTNVVTYDAVSASGLLAANKASFGIEGIPSYYFNKADVIVSFGADFLGTWVNPIEFSAQFAKGRKPTEANPVMNRLYAFEANLSLTGSNADHRAPIKPSAEGAYIAALYNEVASKLGRPTVSGGAVTANKDLVTKAANDLVAAKGKSIVVSGSNDVNVQLLVNGINEMLGNYGSTIDLNTLLLTRQGKDADLIAFVEAAKAGQVGAVIFNDCNPVYDSALGADLKKALGSVGLKVAIATRPDETTAAVDYVAASHHYLESWGDAEPKSGYYSLIQPAITKIFDTRQALETILSWAGNKSEAYNYVQSFWLNNLNSKQTNYASSRDFWNYSLHDGIFEVGAPSLRQAVAAAVKDSTGNVVLPEAVTASGPFERVSPHTASFSGDVNAAASAVESTYKANSTGIDLVVYESLGLGTGRDANNPWLQEFADPVTRACWDNYITIPQSMAAAWGGFKVSEGDTIKATVKVGGKTLTIPVLVQPGQAKETIGLALGYGRTVGGKAGVGIGVNAFELLTVQSGAVKYFASNVTVDKTDEKYRIAHVQTHHTIMGRDIVQGSTLAEYKKKPDAGRNVVKVTTGEGHVEATSMSLWPGHARPNHAWGLVVDMSACIGCGACTIACQVENNVPVVGKEEVLNRREMHWIRIDRYYTSAWKEGDDRHLMEEAAENPQVVYQPMMCQHCNNAPCETVCPVAATTHSTEGLNQMAYNRCIGTRYCANNCPYKVRRFNWFSYPQNPENFPMNTPTLSDLGRMVLNPDVTVRARGVMEKCSMCVQRIQEGKLNAKKEGRRPVDGEVVTACAAACSSGAIIFGDMNDAESRISQVMEREKEKRNYQVLAEINTNPSVSYLTKIRNTADKA